MKREIATLALALTGTFWIGSAVAQDAPLVIGFGASITSMDPHYHNLSTNNNIAQQIFDTLVKQDETQKLIPGLAESWRAIDDTTWEFKLRQGVKFHDGSDFDAADVIATVKRAPNVPNSPSSFRLYVGGIKDIQVVDPLTIRMVTDKPTPLLPNDIASIFIISDSEVGASTADFNSGKAAIGTGPYRLTSYVPGEKVALTRFDGYWGGKEPWTSVTFRIMTNNASRVAALRAGDVAMIDNVPTADLETIKKDKGLSVVSAVSNRIIYLALDHAHDISPFLTDKQGKPLDKNPLKDVRVRRAMSLAINRDGIAQRVMAGQAIPAGQLLPDGFFGTSTNLKADKLDVEGAKKLLAEAGYPNGFAVTLHGPNDRYINDERVLQTVAQNLSRIGIDAKVDAMPWATFSGRATKQEFSVFLVGWGAGTGETSSPLRSLLASFNKDKSMGASNRGRYSNAELDAVIEQAVVTIDDAKRGELLARASEIAMQDLGVIPLHYEVSSWAMKKGLTYKGRADQYTMAQGVRPVR